MTDIATILMLARLSLVAYGIYPAEIRRRVEALGGSYRGQVATDHCAIVLAEISGQQLAIVRGTRVTENTSIKELFDDCDTDVVQTSHGRVMDGFWTPLEKLWPSAELYLDLSRPFTAAGHSLGGVRAELIPALSPRCQRVVSFGAPQGAETEFWKAAYGGHVSLTRVVNEDDFAPGWPWLDGVSVEFSHPAGPFLWLHDGTMDETTTRPAGNLSVSAHSLDDAYIPALSALVSKEAA